MENKKNITQENIVEWYMDDVLMGSDNIHTVYAFAKTHGFDESQFYTFFTDLQQLEKAIFGLFCTNTVSLLRTTEEFGAYDSKNKLLSFYYTFFEMLAANRSYVFLRLKQHKNKLESIQFLTELRSEFLAFVKHLDLTKIDFKNDKINSLQERGMEEAMWVQLLMTIKFWLDDSSKGFEKTDLFIEKLIKAQFDLMDITPINSVFDFAKFLWKEKTMQS